jgi:anaerobic magnesium-protoporphyrin IX monomethyl ester cyclase
MNEVILIRPFTRKKAPIGLFSIASILNHNGYSVTFLDQTVTDNFNQKFIDALENNPLCVGITSMTGPQLKYALDCARLVKQTNKKIPVILGGVHATLFAEQPLKSGLFDIVVQGEGEFIMLELVKALNNGKQLDNIAGLAFKENGRVRVSSKQEYIDLNALPPINYRLFDIEKYIENAPLFGSKSKRSFLINTGRGCSYRCKFCYCTFMGREYRHFPTQSIIDSLKILKKEYGVEAFEFIDDYLFANRKFVNALCQGLIENDIDVLWHGNARVNTFIKYKPETLDLLRDSGCRSLAFGIESGSQRLLDFMGKNINLTQIYRLKEILGDIKFTNHYFSFLFGLPTETRADFIKTIEIIDMLCTEGERDLVEINGYLPFPGTELYDYVIKEGLFDPPDTIEGWADLSWETVNSVSFSKHYKKLLRAVKILFACKKRGFAFRIVYVTFLNFYRLTKCDFILVLLCYFETLLGRVSKKKRSINPTTLDK